MLSRTPHVTHRTVPTASRFAVSSQSSSSLQTRTSRSLSVRSSQHKPQWFIAKRNYAIGTTNLDANDWVNLAESTPYGARIRGSTEGELLKQAELDFDELKMGMETITAHQMLTAREMEKPLVECSANASAWEAINKMSNNECGSVLVRDPSTSKIVGIFTERDYIRKLILQGRSSVETRLADVMTRHVRTITPITTLDDVGEVMAYHGLRHLPVTKSENDCENVLGVISSRDVMDNMVKCAMSTECARKEMLRDNLNDVFEYMEANESSQHCYVEEHSSVFQALQLMDKHKIGGVFVYHGHELKGVFTERDYLKRIILHNRSSRTTRIKEVMTRDVITAAPNTSVYQALNIMVDNRIRTLPIMSLVGNQIDSTEYISKRTLFGMITNMDVIKYIHKLEKGRQEL